MNWQPIETAPKDGTWIIGYCGAQWVVAVSWGTTRGGSLQWCSETNWHSPTHWMPLPPAPVDAQGEITTHDEEKTIDARTGETELTPGSQLPRQPTE